MVAIWFHYDTTNLGARDARVKGPSPVRRWPATPRRVKLLPTMTRPRIDRTRRLAEAVTVT